MSQSKTMSLIEVCVSTFFAFILSVFIQAVVFKLYDIEVSVFENVSIVVIMTVVSIVRSFIFRRIFDWLGEKPINYIKRKLKWNI